MMYNSRELSALLRQRRTLHTAMHHTVKKILNLVSTVCVALAILLTLLLVGARLIGLQVFSVLSGSMEPAYKTGSLIYVKKVDATEIKADDVITFLLDEDTVATHRVVAVVPDEEDPSVLRFRTKGDANATEDGTLVHYKNVIGSPVFTIPYLGYVADYIQNPPGTYVAISVGAILLLLVFLPDLFDDSDKKKQGTTETAEGTEQGTDPTPTAAIETATADESPEPAETADPESR